jgi:hypothetical protein
MDTLLLGITVVALIITLVTSIAAWRLAREDRRRAAARAAALAVATGLSRASAGGRREPEAARSPWAPGSGARLSAGPSAPRLAEPTAAPSDEASGRLFGGTGATSEGVGRQRGLAVAAGALFVVLSLGLVWMMAAPRGTTPRAMGPNNPLELISLRHDRQGSKLEVSGLVRNPASANPVEHLTAVVFLFDPAGAFVASARAPIDFTKLAAGEESPFVVTLDAPADVSRYRVSFRTDEGIVPHVDRRGAPPVATPGELPVSVSLR